MANVYKVLASTGLALPARMPIRLDEQQLARRKHQVKPVLDGDDGWYVSDERLTFKMGEVIEVNGDLPKNLAFLTDQPVPASEPTPVSVDPGKPAKTKKK